METNNKKNGALIVVILFLVLAIGGYFAYTTYFDKKESTVPTNKTPENKPDEEPNKEGNPACPLEIVDLKTVSETDIKEIKTSLEENFVDPIKDDSIAIMNIDGSDYVYKITYTTDSNVNKDACLYKKDGNWVTYMSAIGCVSSLMDEEYDACR